MNSICQHCGKTFADKHKLAVHSLNLAKDEIKRHICENSDFQWHLKSMWFMTTMIFFLKILETLWNSQMVNLPKLPTQHLKFLKDSTIFMLTGCLEHLCTERRPWSQLYGTILEKMGGWVDRVWETEIRLIHPQLILKLNCFEFELSWVWASQLFKDIR